MKILHPHVTKNDCSILTFLPTRPSIRLATAMRLFFNEARVLFSGIDTSLNSFSFCRVESLYSMSCSEFDVVKLQYRALC